MCTPEGHVFDLLHIVPYLRKYGTSPMTGQPLEMKQLIKVVRRSALQRVVLLPSLLLHRRG